MQMGREQENRPKPFERPPSLARFLIGWAEGIAVAEILRYSLLVEPNAKQFGEISVGGLLEGRPETAVARFLAARHGHEVRQAASHRSFSTYIFKGNEK